MVRPLATLSGMLFLGLWREDIALGIATIVGMIALNLAMFGGAAYVVLLAPVAWVRYTVPRYRAVSERLHRRRGHPIPAEEAPAATRAKS